MTNSGPEKRRPNNEEELPIALTRYIRTVGRLVSGSSRTAEEAPTCDSLNYAEPVARTDSANAPRVSDFAVRVVAAAEAGGWHRFDLIGFSLGAAVSPQVLLLPNMRSMQ